MATLTVPMNKSLSPLDICDSTSNNNLWFIVLLLGMCGINCIILLGFMVHACILRTTTCCCSWKACCFCCPSSSDDVAKKKKKKGSWFGRRDMAPKFNSAELGFADIHARDGRDEALQENFVSPHSLNPYLFISLEL
jgi:hypothetical protein